MFIKRIVENRLLLSHGGRRVLMKISRIEFLLKLGSYEAGTSILRLLQSSRGTSWTIMSEKSDIVKIDLATPKIEN